MTTEERDIIKAAFAEKWTDAGPITFEGQEWQPPKILHPSDRSPRGPFLVLDIRDGEQTVTPGLAQEEGDIEITAYAPEGRRAEVVHILYERAAAAMRNLGVKGLHIFAVEKSTEADDREGLYGIESSATYQFFRYKP